MSPHTPLWSAPLFIHGLGVAGPFGCGANALLRGLQDPENALPLSQTVTMRGAGRTLRQRALLADPAPLQDFAPKRSLRRLDRLSRLALLGAHLALQNSTSPLDLKNTGLIIATGYGATATTFAFLDSCIDDGDALASPTHFSHSVHNAAAANVAIHLGLRGPCCTVSQFGGSFASALATARAWLLQGRVDTVLVGAVDEVCDVLAYCHARLCATQDNAALPGEGAAFFLLRATPPGHENAVAFLRETFPAAPDELPALTGSAPCILHPHFAASGRHFPSRPRATHGRLYGALPSGQALDAAVALSCLQQGVFYASADSPRAPLSIGRNQPIHCLHADQDGTFLLTLGLQTLEDDALR